MKFVNSRNRKETYQNLSQLTATQLQGELNKVDVQ